MRSLLKSRKASLLLCTEVFFSALSGRLAYCETISQSLSIAYNRNPDLQGQRASVRADDEGVSGVKSGFRPQLTGSGQFGPNRTEFQGTIAGINIPFRASSFPRQASVSLTQSIFDGNKTTNRVRRAESEVFKSREKLRMVEMQVLQQAATAHMNVLRDMAILELDDKNIVVLEAQLRQTRDRFKQTEVTQTDVAQAQASLSSARATVSFANASLAASMADYERRVGKRPLRLEAARPLDKLLPSTLKTALEIAEKESPGVNEALHAVDAAEAQIKIAEADLYPTFKVQGEALSGEDIMGLPQTKAFVGSVTGQLNVPLYDGGQSFASVRQAKEQLTTARMQVDSERAAVISDVETAWAQLIADKDNLKSTQASIKSYEIALNGVREEARVGTRTTLDILQAQQSLLQARVDLVKAQRDRVVDSYMLAAIVGALTPERLDLNVVSYDPTIHFEQVKDKWFGLRTPDGQ